MISLHTQTHTHTHPFNGPFSVTTQVGWYQKGKTNLDFTEARDSEWQWHQLGHMQVCTSLQTDNHASTSPLSFFTGRMPFLPPNQQRQSTEVNNWWLVYADNIAYRFLTTMYVFVFWLSLEVIVQNIGFNFMSLQCFDAVGWAAGRASGL